VKTLNDECIQKHHMWVSFPYPAHVAFSFCERKEYDRFTSKNLDMDRSINYTTSMRNTRWQLLTPIDYGGVEEAAVPLGRAECHQIGITGSVGMQICRMCLALGKSAMVTIYDIAKAAGVAKSTVANALSGKGTVSETTRERVLQYAHEMGYRPNELARSFSSHKTFTIALILPTIANPFYSEIVEAIEQTAEQQDYQTLFSNTHFDFALGRKQMERMIGRWVDGYIIMGASMDFVDVRTYFQQGRRIVLCDWQENEMPKEIPQVSVDFLLAGQLAAEHLLSLGHRHVGVIVDAEQQSLRLQGFQSAFAAAGIPLPAEAIISCSANLECGGIAAKELLARPNPPTALFAATDWMAIGAMEAVQEAGLRVPADISIIGLDDIFVSAHLRPSLTTVAIPKVQLAQQVTQLLLRQMDGHQTQPISRLVEPSLVIRQSTAVAKTD
jgi:DNA-binding LacI/PurR family transcriptional regulator